MWEYQWSVGRLWPGRGSINVLPTHSAANKERERKKRIKYCKDRELRRKAVRNSPSLYLITAALKVLKSNEESFVPNVLLLLSVIYHLTSSSTLNISLAVTTVLFHRFNHSGAEMLFPLSHSPMFSPFTYSVCIFVAAHTAVSQRTFPHIDPRSAHTNLEKKTHSGICFLMSHWPCSWIRFCCHKSVPWIGLIAAVLCSVCGSRVDAM